MRFASQVVAFFPSYKFEAECHRRWLTTGTLERLRRAKPAGVFREERAGAVGSGGGSGERVGKQGGPAPGPVLRSGGGWRGAADRSGSRGTPTVLIQLLAASLAASHRSQAPTALLLKTRLVGRLLRKQLTVTVCAQRWSADRSARGSTSPTTSAGWL